MNRVVLRRLVQVLVVAAVVLSAADVVACPSCKAALASSDGEQGNWVGGFFWSILFMLSMPIAIVTAWGLSIYRMVRKARRQAPPQSSTVASRTDSELVQA